MARRLREPAVAGWLALGVAIAVSAALVAWLQRDVTWGSDEFFWLQIGGLGHVDFFWHPYGGHLIALPFFVYRGVLELWGADFTAYTVIQVVGLSFAGALLYVYAKRRIGPILALAPAAILLFLGSSWTVVLQPMIGIQFLCALLPSLGALLMLEREDWKGDLAACALLCLALTGFTQALAFLVGAIVAVLLGRNWRRLWVVAIPLVAYGLWRHWASQFGPTPIHTSNFPFLPANILDSLGVIASSVFGLARYLGPGPWTYIRMDGFEPIVFAAAILMTVAEIAVVVGAIWLIRRRGPIPRSLWVPVAVMITLWLEQGVVLGPGRTPAEIRYIYAGTLVLLLVVSELLRGVRTTRLTVGIALAVTILAVFGNLFRFREGHQILDSYSEQARADMTVIQLAGKNVDPVFTPNIDTPDLVPGGLTLNTGAWLAVVERYGSTADSIPQLRRRSDAARDEADQLAARALELRLVPVPEGARGCRPAHDNGGGVALPPGGAVLRAAAGGRVSLRRWADGFVADVGDLTAGRPGKLRIPPDPSSVPWRLRLDPAGPLEVCALGAGGRSAEGIH